MGNGAEARRVVLSRLAALKDRRAPSFPSHETLARESHGTARRRYALPPPNEPEGTPDRASACDDDHRKDEPRKTARPGRIWRRPFY